MGVTSQPTAGLSAMHMYLRLSTNAGRGMHIHSWPIVFMITVAALVAVIDSPPPYECRTIQKGRNALLPAAIATQVKGP